MDVWRHERHDDVSELPIQNERRKHRKRMTDERDYVARLESRQDGGYSDLNALVEAIEQRGYQTESNPSNGSVEVCRA